MEVSALPHDPSLKYWLGKPVPRYTSYPPATAFRADLPEAAYSNCIKQLASDARLSLYIHIPFCRSLCLYCGCNTGVTNRADRLEKYMSVLCKEIEQIARLLPKKAKVTSIHWGGGTPNILTDHAITTLFALLNRLFDLKECREMAMEIDPRHADPKQMRLLASCGINRVSLGVQDFNEDVQRLVHRVQPFATVKRACNALHAAGIGAVNFDLMYGLPLQTPESVAETATLVTQLQPQRISLFSYAHVPQFKKHQQALERAGIPDRFMRLAMDRAARDVFIESGYEEIGMDHFALPGDSLLEAMRERRLHRNFQGYTEDNGGALIGFGASSISHFPDAWFQNERDTTLYETRLDMGLKSWTRGILLSAEDRLRAAIIEQLMCTLDCDIAEICAAHDFPITRLASSLSGLTHLKNIGLIQKSGAQIKLISPYRMAIRAVCQAFDCYELSRTASRVA